MSWIQGWSQILPTESLETLRKDCAIAFNSRAVEATENYSTGSTYFIKANEEPCNSLERIAKSIFEYHTRGKSFNIDKSGAEWWTQVIHPGDDIGTHWDRDYGLEEEDGVHVHPFYGTITYLSTIGGPTIVLNKRGSANANDEIVGGIEDMAVCSCSNGNHVRFDGNLLHAAPAEITRFEDEEDVISEEDGEDDDDEAEELEVLLTKLSKRRITFLVNIWIDHIPSQSQRYEKSSELPQLSNESTLSSLNFDRDLSLNNSAVHITSASAKDGDDNIMVNITEEKQERTILLQFNQHDLLYNLSIPLPSVSFMKELLESRKLVILHYPEREVEKKIQLLFSEIQLSEAEFEDGDIDDDEDSDLIYEEDEGDDNDTEAEDEEDEEEQPEHPKKRARR